MATGLSMGSIPTTAYGWIAFVLLGIGTFFLNFRKGKVDESALVLGEWRKLYEAHEKRIEAYEGRIAALTDEFDRHREEARLEAARLNERVGQLEQENSALKQRISQLEDENAGLRRTIIQNSQSTGVMLSRPDMVAGSKAIRKEPKK